MLSTSSWPPRPAQPECQTRASRQPKKARRILAVRTVRYGPPGGDLFTPRQLVALTTFSDLVGEAIERVRKDAVAAGLPDDDIPLRDGGTGALGYAQAVGVYLGLGVSRLSDICNALCGWEVSKTQVRHLFTRQAIPMVWDYGENNLFGGAAGDYNTSLMSIVRVMGRTLSSDVPGTAHQGDARTTRAGHTKIVSTDPPYYDNIGYADLSDFFYIWLRRCLKPVFPELFGTLAVPKADELVATPYRHGSKDAAERFFLHGMTRALRRLAEQAHPSSPVTVYYAFKQSETRGGSGTSSTGWETFLEAATGSGFMVTGTWPLRTELANRMIAAGTNALASSIVLVCRPRPADAPLATRREFLTTLRSELPAAVAAMLAANIAPVDLAQAAIGPGMAVYTRYAKVFVIAVIRTPSLERGKPRFRNPVSHRFWRSPARATASSRRAPRYAKPCPSPVIPLALAA